MECARGLGSLVSFLLWSVRLCRGFGLATSWLPDHTSCDPIRPGTPLATGTTSPSRAFVYAPRYKMDLPSHGDQLHLSSKG